MKPKYWWIKERHNPQLGVYYVAVGPLSVKDAKAMERPGYGSNYMLRFDSAREYEAKLRQLCNDGHKVQ